MNLNAAPAWMAAEDTLFVDPVHTNGEGNRLVASILLDHLAGHLLA